MIIACILVPLFMLFYYHFSGLVANIALMLNMLILFAVMRAFNAAFTLTGFAGLALTVGMAVDNNILVFERLREELDRGATLRMAIRNAFHRAGTTIIDCNLTHLIAATVLYWIGSDQIKGFAITLWIGVVTSMFTSVFVARVIFDVAEKRQWLTKAKMLRLIGHTNIDFMGWFPYLPDGFHPDHGDGDRACRSTAGRGCSTSTSPAAFRCRRGSTRRKKSATSATRWRSQPEKVRLPDLAINDVWSKPEEQGLEFIINTSEPNMNVVKSRLTEVFGDKLAHNSVDFTAPVTIPDGEEGGPAGREAVRRQAGGVRQDRKGQAGQGGKAAGGHCRSLRRRLAIDAHASRSR